MMWTSEKLNILYKAHLSLTLKALYDPEFFSKGVCFVAPSHQVQDRWSWSYLAGLSRASILAPERAELIITIIFFKSNKQDFDMDTPRSIRGHVF